MNITRDQLSRWAGQEVARVLAALPEALRLQAEEVTIIQQHLPDAELVRDGIDPDLMGLFVGDTFQDESSRILPATVYLFLGNIWDEVDHDPVAFRQEVGTTLLHELGHYLGLDEDELDERGLA